MEGTRPAAKGIAALRIVLGSGFLKGATAGSLPGSAANAVVNPTHGFWVAIGGNPGLMSVINTMVVSGEILIGLALILGLATRFAGVLGGLMMAFFWIANFDFAHGLVNEQFLYGIVAAFVAYSGAGEAYGLDAVIEKAKVVTEHPRLRYVLG